MFNINRNFRIYEIKFAVKAVWMELTWWATLFCFLIHHHLGKDEKAELLKVFNRWGNLLDAQLGRTSLIAHVIGTEKTKPIKLPL